ncbi:MAG: hypothetical protein ACI9MB_004136 [Verrucomicrobiales bacterium]|jgi:hypothetical protein
MKLFLALAAIALAALASSCSSNDADLPSPAESKVWRMSPGGP